VLKGAIVGALEHPPPLTQPRIKTCQPIWDRHIPNSPPSSCEWAY